MDVVKNVRRVYTGKSGRQPGVPAKQSAGPQEEARAQRRHGQEIAALQRRRQRQPGRVQRQRQVVAQRRVIIEEGKAEAVRQVGQPARVQNAMIDGAGQLGQPVQVEQAVATPGYVARQERIEGRQKAGQQRQRRDWEMVEQPQSTGETNGAWFLWGHRGHYVMVKMQSQAGRFILIQ
jgi:hypothetical protein